MHGKFAPVRPSFCCECSLFLWERGLERAERLCVHVGTHAATGLRAAAAQFSALALLVLVSVSCLMFGVQQSVLHAWPLLTAGSRASGLSTHHMSGAVEVATENNLSGDFMELVRKPLLWLQNMLILPQTISDKCVHASPSPQGHGVQPASWWFVSLLKCKSWVWFSPNYMWSD